MTAWMRGLADLAGVDGLTDPGRLPVLLLLAAGAVALSLRHRPRGLPWAALPELGAAARGGRDRLPAGRAALRLGALACLAVALAGPVRARPPERAELPGLDLLLVLDLSDSMRALDAEVGGRPRTRLALARRVVARFARRRVAEGDRLGLVGFGDRALTLCPLTRDERLLEAALRRARAGMAGEATALGDALALAARRVLAGSSPAAGAADGEPTAGARAGSVVVLLTDGRANAGAIPVEAATALAASLGVRVHTVGIGSEGPVAMARDERGRRGLELEHHDLDAATLAAIAGATGGEFFRARTSADLDAIYRAIDELERVPRPVPVPAGRRPWPEPVLAAAGCLLAAEILLAAILRRRIP